MIIEWEGSLLPEEIGCVQSALEAAEEGLALDFAIGIHLSFVPAEEIRALNRAQRDIDRATDVLSFPTCAFPESSTALDDGGVLRREYDPDMRACFLGDIVICRAIAREQAKEYGHSLERELAFLAVHGFAHLLGFDHETGEDRTAMRAFEEGALERAGLSRTGG